MPDIFTLTGFPDGSLDPDEEIAISAERFRVETNSFFHDVESPVPLETFPYKLFLDSRADIRLLEQWFESTVYGMQKAFWVASYNFDLEPIDDVLPGTFSLDIKYVGYTERFFPYEYRRHLAGIAKNGAITHVRVEASVDNGDGTETLTLSGGIGIQDSAKNAQISFLKLVRNASDDLTIKYHNPGGALAECTLSLIELPHEVPATV